MTGRKWYSLAALLLAGLVLALAPVATAQDAILEGYQAAVEDAQTALDDGNYEAAVDAFTKAIEEGEKVGADVRMAYVGRAVAYSNLNEDDKAAADFDKAGQLSQINPLPPEGLYARGDFLLEYRGGQLIGAAIGDLQAAYQSNTEDLRYVFSLGKAYALISPQAPQFAGEAVKLLTKFLETEANSNNAEALRLRGQAYATQQKFEEAMADIKRSLELEPDNHEAYFALGILEVQQKNWAEAIDALGQAIDKYKPEEGDESGLPYVQAYLIMASVHEEAGKASDDPEIKRQAYEHSVETCNVLLELLPEDSPQLNAIKSQTMFRRGVGQRLLGQFAAAAQSLTEAINLNPEFSEAYFRRAIVYTSMEEEPLALRDLEAAQALKYDDARAYLWEGITYAQMGQYRDAIRSYNEAISFSNRYVDAFRNRAHAYFQLEEYQQAIENFNECIRLQPEEPRHFYKRGICYAALEQPDRAERSWAMALEVDPKFTPALEQLAAHYQATGRAELASQYRQRLEDLRKGAE